MTPSAVILGRADPATVVTTPLMGYRVQAGFPSPADDHLDGRLDLNERYVRNPTATFFVVADGDSMINAGIRSGDLLIVDRSLRPTPGCIVIACLDGELTVKRYMRRGSRIVLQAENPAYPAIEIRDDQEITMWGVVTHSIHDTRPKGSV